MGEIVQKNGIVSMNLVLVGLAYPFRGGISQYTTFLYNHLKQDYNLCIISYKRLYPRFLFPGKTQYDESKLFFQVENDRIIDSIQPLSWIKAARHILKQSPQMVIFQWWNPFFAFPYYIMGKFLKKKTIIAYICHNVEPHEHSWLDRSLTKLAFSTADHLVVHSRSDQAKAIKHFPEKPVSRTVLPLFDAFPSGDMTPREIRKELGIENQKKILLFFGLIRKYKGLHTLIDALALFSKENSPLLLIAGEFYDSRDNYTDHIQEAGVGDRIITIAHYIPNEDVYKYFTIAEAVVLPYLTATQSAIARIAWLFKCPIIASEVGGLPDIIKSPDEGILVKPGDKEALYLAIKEILKPDVVEKIRVNMKKNSNRFNWQKVKETLLNIIASHK